MKRIALALISVAAVALAGCNGTSDTLTNGNGGGNPNGTASNEPGNTFDHQNDPGGTAATQPTTDPAQVQAVGAPEVTARLHSCGKLTYTSLGNKHE